jgi:hypothetical protein
MRVMRHPGADRVIDVLRSQFLPGRGLDLVTPTFLLFVFEALRRECDRLRLVRMILPAATADPEILGTAADRGARNRLQQRWLARRCGEWIERNPKTSTHRSSCLSIT